MRTHLVQIALACAVAAAGLAAGDLAAQPASTGSGQAYPSRPIRVIDAYPPGGSTDIVARIISAKFQESTGQPWVIDNRPGAQGIIGSEVVARAVPDGYTLLMFTGSMTVHPSIYAKMPYERLLGLGAEPVGNSSEQFAAFLKKDIALWAKVVKDAKIPLQTW